MRLNIYAVLGSIIGWFVIGPLFRPLPYFELTMVDMLQRGIIGLMLAIIFGLFFGTIDDYFEAKLKHAKLMQEYYKLKREINDIDKKIDKMEIENGRRLNAKKYK